MLDLRTTLHLDTVASVGLGALLLALSPVLDEPLGLPVALSATVGAGLLGWAGLVAWVARTGSRQLAREVVVGNALWVPLSIGFAVSGWVDLTGLGVGFVLLQAAAVAVLSAEQAMALRTRQPVAAA